MKTIEFTFESQRAFYDSQATKEIAYRLHALKQLAAAIRKYEDEINIALNKDLNKSVFDSYSTEIGFVLEEISFAVKRLKCWTKPKKVKTALTHFGTKGYRYPEPYGVVLIIAPWNYPFQLIMSPLIGAIAAGNCAMVKPSELSKYTSAVVNKIISNLFDSDYICVVEGDSTISEALLALPFNYIFFTGSERVGKLVMEAAAKHLTPITLELGGKSPVIVNEDADLRLAAKRIVWGKFLNAGQTCVAPDYLYVHTAVFDSFVQCLIKSIYELFGQDPLSNIAYSKIISKEHFERLTKLLNEGMILEGGKVDEANLKIQPTLVANLDWGSKLMEGEIFGPILPVLRFNSLKEPLEEIKKRSHPLAFYFFAKEKKLINQVIQEIECGGICINDVVYHIVTPYLPFGGKGKSGMGGYHGRFSFDTFTHYKSILKQSVLFDLPFRYPNFKGGLKFLKMFLK